MKAMGQRTALQASAASAHAETKDLWHRCHEHVGYRQLSDLAKAVKGMDIDGADYQQFCEPCVYAKQHR